MIPSVQVIYRYVYGWVSVEYDQPTTVAEQSTEVGTGTATSITVRAWLYESPSDRASVPRHEEGLRARLRREHREACQQHFAPGRFDARDQRPTEAPRRRVWQPTQSGYRTTRNG